MMIGRRTSWRGNSELIQSTSTVPLCALIVDGRE